MGLFKNKTDLPIAVILLSAMVISCATFQEVTRGGASEKAEILNESVPAGMEHAEQDYEATQPSAFKIIMPRPGQILLQDPDSQPVDIATLGTKVREVLGTRPPESRIVYIAAAVDVPTSELAAVIAELRRQKIETVKLLTSARNPEADEGGLFSQPAVAPDRVLELKIEPEPEPEPEIRPNPLLLFITTGPSGTPVINNEPKADLKALATLLNEIFADREANGVLRANTNEVEKTVLVKLSADEPDRKYGDFVKLVNAVKGGGASPIVLTEGIKFPKAPEISSIFDDMPPPPPNRKDPPDVISGGVLIGKARSLPKPPYPAAAKAVKATGAVSVEVTIDTEGNVIEAKAVSGHPLLRSAAESAARTAKFSPTMLSGKPVKVKGVLIYNFPGE